jgi:hypothetical protein
MFGFAETCVAQRNPDYISSNPERFARGRMVRWKMLSACDRIPEDEGILNHSECYDLSEKIFMPLIFLFGVFSVANQKDVSVSIREKDLLAQRTKLGPVAA